ncbi:MAG: ribonuclease R [Ignavibacteria bacterium RBG_13_36_8]|nr:MAG: ribonuclease R [Ignavibacteria bacterium RBG_13_36_8]
MKRKVKTFFKENPHTSIKPKELAQKLKISESEIYSELKQILYELRKEGFIEKKGKRYNLSPIGIEKLIGTLHIVNGGNYGFVSFNNPHIKDIFVPEKYLGTALHDDTVEVSLLAKTRGKNLEGQIVEIIKRAHEEVVGTLKKTKSFYFVIPDEKNIHRDIYISEKNLNGAKDGDKVSVNKIEWRSPQLNPEGKIKEIFGKAGSYDAETAAIAQEFNLSYKFPNEVLDAVGLVPDKIPQTEIAQRTDLRNKNTFTIDPVDAKDFDDAVSIETLENGNFLIGVHIADVSYYVQEDSPIYEEAKRRGTSVYIVGKVIPMLPERLSNKICSLIPEEDRLTYSVLIELSPQGKIISYNIKKTIINSKRRFTYDEVQNIIKNKIGDYTEDILLLNKVANVLRKKRMRKGSIDFYTPEVEFVLDGSGFPIDIKIKEVKESHNLIEELMLLANKIIASHINSSKKTVPFIYRIHDLPDREKINEFSRFVKSLGYSFDAKATKNSKQFQKILEEVKGTDEESVVNEVAIRSMAKAVYSTNNIGHYGLGFNYYTHFTSPIRRFPDLAVHKLIYQYIENSAKNFPSLQQLDEICTHSSYMERNALEAERLSIKLKQMEFMQSKIGYEFHGIISGITHFGIFIEISQNLAEGLIRLRDMQSDYYIFNEKQYSIIGKHTGKRYRLGDRVIVKLARVDKEKREIDFVLSDN